MFSGRSFSRSIVECFTLFHSLCFQMELQIAIFGPLDSKRLQRLAIVSDGLPCFQIELIGMKRADHSFPAHNSIGQQGTLVRTKCLS